MQQYRVSKRQKRVHWINTFHPHRQFNWNFILLLCIFLQYDHNNCKFEVQVMIVSEMRPRCMIQIQMKYLVFFSKWKFYSIYTVKYCSCHRAVFYDICKTEPCAHGTDNDTILCHYISHSDVNAQKIWNIIGFGIIKQYQNTYCKLKQWLNYWQGLLAFLLCSDIPFLWIKCKYTCQAFIITFTHHLYNNIIPKNKSYLQNRKVINEVVDTYLKGKENCLYHMESLFACFTCHMFRSKTAVYNRILCIKQVTLWWCTIKIHHKHTKE